jgi:tetratricopeptide (TPR) repeat protein
VSTNNREVDSAISQSRPAAQALFAPNGEFWTIGHAGKTFSIKSSKGLAYIHRLMQHPGEEFHSLDLLSGPGTAFIPEAATAETSSTDSSLTVGRLGDAGEMLDPKAKRDYKSRLIELREELEDASELGNSERAAEIESEIDFLAREISRAVGLSGRDRRAGSAAERARLNVTRAIKTALQKVSEHDSSLGELLSRSTRTGSFCTFVEDRDAKITWTLSLDGHESDLQRADSAPSRFSQPPSLLQIKADRTKFVGRDVEQTALRRYVELARAGNGSMVMIAGPPGIGKTRIASEIAAEAARTGFFVLAGCCQDRDDSVPFNPFVEILESALAQTPRREVFRSSLGDGAEELARLMPQLRRIFTDLPSTLEVSPEQSRRLLLNAFVEFVSRTAANGPVLLLLDDLHWGDEGTFSLLNHLARFVAKLPVMVLGTYRDNELDRAGELAGTLDKCMRLHVLEQISLANLSEMGVTEMIAALSGREPPGAVVDAIYSGSEGNPFFIEELFEHLKERGKLLDSAGQFRRSLSLDASDVPENLRLVIGRRLGRLGVGARKFLDTAAVIGSSFTFGLLEASTGAESEDLLDGVEEAEESGLISSRVEYPEARFHFSHELIRQAVLADLSVPRRQRINLHIADAIERLFAGGLEESVHDLAHHLSQAGSAADAEKTIKYLLMAASQARAQSAYEAAISYFRNALEVLNRVPANDDRDQKELQIYLEYLPVLSFTHQFTTTRVGLAHARAKELCERLGQASAMYELLSGTAAFHLRRGDHHKSHDLARRILELSESSMRPDWGVAAHYLMGHTLCCLGNLASAHEHLSEAARIEDSLALRTIEGATAKVFALGVDALTLWTLGYADRSLVRIDEAIAFSGESKNPYDLAVALIMGHVVNLFRRDYVQALQFADRGLSIAAQKQFEWLKTSLAWSRAACWVLCGMDKCIDNTTSAFQVYFGTEAGLYKPDNCTVLAECCGVLEQPEVGLPMIDEAFSAMQGTDERRCEPETWRVKGTLLLQMANRRGDRANSKEALKAESEACFRKAIEIADAQGSKAWELRAGVDLSRLLIASDRRDEARNRLLPIVDWFTEGFETPDFLAAKAVLKELSS